MEIALWIYTYFQTHQVVYIKYVYFQLYLLMCFKKKAKDKHISPKRIYIWGKKHMKACTTELAIREMQIKTTIRYYCPSTQRRKWQPTPVFLPRESWTEEPGGLLSTGSHRVGHDWSDLACMRALEKAMATHSSVLAWRIPGMEEPGGLPSMGSHRVRHD